MQHVTVSDRAFVFDPNDGTFTDAHLPGGPKLKLDHDELGPYFYDPENPQADIVRPKGAELKQFVNYQPIPDGVTYRVPATTAAQGDATIAASNASAANEGRKQAARDANEQAQRNYQNEYKRWQAAQTASDEYNKTWRALSQNMAEMQALGSDPNFSEDSAEFRQLLQQNRRLSSEVTAAQSSLRERHGNRVKFLDSGYAEVGPEPQQPNVIPAPPPVTRLPAGRPGASSTRAPMHSGAYAGMSFSHSQMPELRKRFPGKSDAEIQQVIKANGGRFVSTSKDPLGLFN